MWRPHSRAEVLTDTSFSSEQNGSSLFALSCFHNVLLLSVPCARLKLAGILLSTRQQYLSYRISLFAAQKRQKSQFFRMWAHRVILFGRIAYCTVYTIRYDTRCYFKYDDDGD